jgi:hypothetical protein
MPTTSVQTSTNVDGVPYTATETVTFDGTVKTEPSLAAAKTGSLSTRSSATAGTLTMDPGHGITNGQRIDIYWSGGSVYGATVGTVATNSVPFTGAAGTLPAQGSAVTVMVADEETFAVTAANLQTLIASVEPSGVNATAVFCQSNGTVVKAATMAGGGLSYIWTVGSGAATPFGADVAKVYLTHGDSTSARTVRAVAVVS